MSNTEDVRTTVAGADPITGSLEREGVSTAWLDWGGDGPPIIFLHPNGFCAGMYHPLARCLIDRYRVVGVDLRGHGASDDVVDVTLLGNDVMALDVLAVADHLSLDTFALVGVSFGAAVAIELAAQAPGQLSALILCEAIAINEAIRDKQQFGFSDREYALAAGARRRREVWENRSSAEVSYGSRPPLDAIDPEVLAGYVRWGFRDRSDGLVELSCRPETEALIFGSHDRHGPAQAFEALRQVASDGRVPTAVMAGEQTHLDPELFVAQASILEVELQLVAGGHFCLFEDLELAERLIDDNLQTLITGNTDRRLREEGAEL